MSSSERTDGTRAVLFEGDTGELSFDARRVLVQLLAGPSLESDRHSQLWPVLLKDEETIRTRLADVFLDLVIDYDLEIAFTRQTDAGDLEIPKLLRRMPLTYIDSVLLLFLREQLIHFENQGERTAVSMDEMLEHLLIYEKGANTDRAGFTKKAQGAIEKAKNHSILRKIRSSEDRYEVSPTLKLLFSAEEILALSKVYRDLATGVHATTKIEADEEEAGT